MEYIDFEGHYINKSKITAVGKVEKYSNGPSLCDWEYGFKICLEGGQYIKIEAPSYPYSLSNEQKKEDLERKREKLKTLLKTEHIKAEIKEGKLHIFSNSETGSSDLNEWIGINWEHLSPLLHMKITASYTL